MVARPLNLAHQGLPVWPGLACLHDALDRVGAVDVAGVHAVLPLQLDAHHLDNFADTYEWFQPAGGVVPRQEFAVSLHTAGGRGCDPEELRRATDRRAAALLDVRTDPQPASGVVDPERLGARWMFDGELRGAHFRCRGPEWGLDMAAFIIDVVACAAREIGVEQTALLTASRIDGER